MFPVLREIHPTGTFNRSSVPRMQSFHSNLPRAWKRPKTLVEVVVVVDFSPPNWNPLHTKVPDLSRYKHQSRPDDSLRPCNVRLYTCY